MKNILKAFVITILFASCQKELVNEDKPQISFLVKTFTETRNGVVTTTNFNYDSEGKVTSTTSSSGENKFFKYTSNSFTAITYNGTVLLSTDVYYLNNNLLLVDSAVHFGKTDTTSTKYIYDGNRLLVQVKDYKIVNSQSTLSKTTTAEYDGNGNVAREYNTNNTQISYVYTNFPYTLNVGLIYSTTNKNLIKTSTYTGAINTVLNYSYTFDSSNRLTNETVVDNNGKTIVVKDYTY
jgi:hypothetical protein